MSNACTSLCYSIGCLGSCKWAFMHLKWVLEVYDLLMQLVCLSRLLLTSCQTLSLLLIWFIVDGLRFDNTKELFSCIFSCGCVCNTAGQAERRPVDQLSWHPEKLPAATSDPDRTLHQKEAESLQEKLVYY